MKYLSRQTLILYGVLFSLFGLWGCGSQVSLTPEEKAWLNRQNHTLRIAQGIEAPPMLFTDENGKYDGLVVDYYRILARKLDLKLVHVPVKNWKHGVNRIKAGEIDMILMQSSPERAQVFTFTKPYIRAPYVVITLKGKQTPLGKVTRLAVVTGNLLGEYVRNRYPGIEIVPAENNLHALKMVADQKVNACGINLAYATRLIEKHGLNQLAIAGETGFINELGFAVPKTDERLAAIIEKVLAGISPKDHQKIQDKWIRLERFQGHTQTPSAARYVPLALAGLILLLVILALVLSGKKRLFPILHFKAGILILFVMVALSAVIPLVLKHSAKGLRLTPAEKAWLKSNGVTLNKCIQSPPVFYIDAQGRNQGIAIDYARPFFALLNQEIQWACATPWEKAVEALKNGEVTLGLMQASQEGKKDFYFSKPILSFPYVLVTRRSVKGLLTMEDLSGKIVTTVKGFAIEKYIRDHYPKVIVETVPDHRSGLFKAAFDKNNVFAGNLAYCIWQVRKLGITNLKVSGETGFINELSLATTRQNTLFSGIMDKTLAAIPEQRRQSIKDKWLPTREKPFLDPKTGFMVTVTCLGLFSLALLALLWNYALRRTLRRQGPAPGKPDPGQNGHQDGH